MRERLRCSDPPAENQFLPGTVISGTCSTLDDFWVPVQHLTIPKRRLILPRSVCQPVPSVASPCGFGGRLYQGRTSHFDFMQSSAIPSSTANRTSRKDTIIVNKTTHMIASKARNRRWKRVKSCAWAPMSWREHDIDASIEKNNTRRSLPHFVPFFEECYSYVWWRLLFSWH